jgi:hypothetical protein
MSREIGLKPEKAGEQDKVKGSRGRITAVEKAI